MNYQDFMRQQRGPQDQRNKRFSMNYADFLGRQGTQQAPKDKRFSMNYADFLGQQGTQQAPREKRFSINYLDTLAVPVGGYWDVEPRHPDKRMYAGLIFRSGGRGRSVLPVAKRFSMNYHDFKDWEDGGESEREMEEKLKLEKKRFTMNFQDTIQEDQDGTAGTRMAAPSGGWGERGERRALQRPGSIVEAATTTAQTEDTKRAPPSPPTESALGMGAVGGRGRGKELPSEKNLQSAR